MSKYIVGVGFDSPKLSYYEIETDVNVGQEVVVETSLGFELGKIQIVKNYKESDEGLFPHVLRLATFQDKSTYAKNIEKGKIVGKSVQELSNSMQLNMNVIQAMFSLDNTKVLITYTSDDRVDFRELLKVLSGQLKCRIELRQIGPRDKAGIVGGLGVCGLKLCCSSFLDTFDGISISMAKNQMLSLNIPKLSGHCGKLMCCLKYEDQAYSELKTYVLRECAGLVGISPAPWHFLYCPLAIGQRHSAFQRPRLGVIVVGAQQHRHILRVAFVGHSRKLPILHPLQLIKAIFSQLQPRLIQPRLQKNRKGRATFV